MKRTASIDKQRPNHHIKRIINNCMYAKNVNYIGSPLTIVTFEVEE